MRSNAYSRHQNTPRILDCFGWLVAVDFTYKMYCDGISMLWCTDQTHPISHGGRTRSFFTPIQSPLQYIMRVIASVTDPIRRLTNRLREAINLSFDAEIAYGSCSLLNAKTNTANRIWLVVVKIPPMVETKGKDAQSLFV